MKKTNADLFVERSISNDINTNGYAADTKKEEVAAIVNTERTVNIEEPVLAKESFCNTEAKVEIKRNPIITNTSFSVKEEDEEVRAILDNGLRLLSGKEVEVNYATGNSVRSASINQTIATKPKESSSYNVKNEEAKANVVFEENINTRTEDVELLMGEL